MRTNRKKAAPIRKVIAVGWRLDYGVSRFRSREVRPGVDQRDHGNTGVENHGLHG